MRVSLHKGQRWNTLRCHRGDGSTSEADVGPGLPAHDLAHWVAEEALGLDTGFFGLVAAGRALEELADPRRLPQPAADGLAVAEIWARALGAAAAGASTPDEVARHVREELGEGAEVPPVSVVVAMVARVRGLVSEWVKLPIGATLTLSRAFGSPAT